MDASSLEPLFDDHEQDYGFPRSNVAMIQDLVATRSLRSEVCLKAFAAVDRQCFWVEGVSDITYIDVPLRHGRLHLSAPQIYAEALESLMPLKPGMSFLNVGSGTGYFNSLVSEIIGELSTNHGIEIWAETIAHACDKCQSLGKKGIEFFLGNVYELDVNATMRYDRIYIGACANSRSKYLYRLLEVGGVLVGPFQVGRSQQLRRVVRETETEFSVQVLESVRFATLVEPDACPSTNDTEARAELQDISAWPTSKEGSRRSSISKSEVGLPDVPFTFALHDNPWMLSRNCIYPLSFRLVLAMALRNRSQDDSARFLPSELWTQHILPFCSKRWFDCDEHRSGPISEDRSPLAMLPNSGQRQKVDADADICSDDGGSTVAPSTAGGSQAHSPMSQPDPSPIAGAEAIEDSMLLDAAILFEVFGNGQRYAIGSEDHPDDVEDPRHNFAIAQHWASIASTRATGEAALAEASRTMHPL